MSYNSTTATTTAAAAADADAEPLLPGGEAETADAPHHVPHATGAVSPRSDILSGPILPALARMALPTTVVLVAQIAAVVAETYYVGLLGTDALAGVALVFPIWMLMAMMSNGGIGSGVSSAVARAVGSGRREDANALVFHAVLFGTLFGAGFTTFALLEGPDIYRGMGGHGASLEAAVHYSNYLFICAIPVWIVNLLAAALRGSGNVKLPAMVTFAGTFILVPLSPILIFGWGPIPRLGIAGAGLAMGIYYASATVVLIRHLTRAGAGAASGLRLTIARPSRRLTWDILRVGIPVSITTLQVNGTVIVLTALVGRFGVEAIAGFGIASRLDYLMIPLGFGLGTAVLSMVGINVGAGQITRAKRIAWIGGAIGAAMLGGIGIVVALFPGVWLHMYTDNPAVLSYATPYLQTVAPFYSVLGLGFVLSFAAQGAGRMTWPFIGSTTRMLVAAGAGWLLVAHHNAGLPTLWMIVAASLLVYAACAAVAVLKDWELKKIPV